MSYRAYRALTGLLWPFFFPFGALRAGARRIEWRQRMGQMPEDACGRVWLHAASVGEVAAVTPLVRALSEAAPGVFLTVVTPTGRDAAVRSGVADATFAPLDFVPAVRRALDTIRPRALLLTETELWPNTIWETVTSGVPTGVVNGRLSKRSLRRYLTTGSPVPETARRLSFAACRTALDAERFVRLGLDRSRVSVVGDMKYDKLENPLDQAGRDRLALSLGVPGETRVALFGSVRPKEEAWVAQAAAELLSSQDDLLVILAPRHLERAAPLVEALAARDVASTLRSTLADPPGRLTDRALVLDTTGELALVYALADVAFVGGTLAPYGGHDPLEPAAQGVPVVLGVHTESCREAARRLVDAGAAFRVERPEELGRTILELMSNITLGERARESALNVVAEGRGATQRTLELLGRMGIVDDGGA